jgi:hypothetical protein
MEIWGTRFFQVRCQGAKKYKHALHRFNAFSMDFTGVANDKEKGRGVEGPEAAVIS